MLPTYPNETYDTIGTPTCFLTGAAGTGKSYLIRQKLAEDPSYGLPLATTGIAALNLNSTTVHSALGFSNTETIRQAYYDGALAERIARHKANGYQWLMLDEISMFGHEPLDYIALALEEVNASRSSAAPLGLMLIGDMLQLPPVPDEKVISGAPVFNAKGQVEKWPTPWAFEADVWEKFEKTTIKLTKVWRQDNQMFLSALNFIRAGNGRSGAIRLQQAGVKFVPSLKDDRDKDWTIIVGTNKEADMINRSKINELAGNLFVITSERWTSRKHPPSEWKYVEPVQQLKVGALVMLLANDYPTFSYVNGDLAHITGFRTFDSANDDAFLPEPLIELELVRNGTKILLPKITRYTWQMAEPDPTYVYQNKERITRGRVPGVRRQVWITGELRYYPLRLAYASTVHRCQGLTLDKAIVNIGSNFFYHPAMVYVALSRVKSPEGLIVVGSVDELAKKVRIDQKVRKFL